MEHFLKKHYKWIALIVGISLVAQMFVFVLNGKGDSDTSRLPEPQDDGVIAADISNMTGVEAEDILKLKQSGLTWNEVLEKLKTTGSDNQGDKDKRSELLAGTGIEETISMLQEQGHTEEEIVEAKMTAERLQFQLNEIAAEDVGAPQIPTPVANAEEKKDKNTETIHKLAEQFDLSTAVYCMVILKKELGSLEAVLDEYLLSLQIGVSLKQFISDKDAYLKAKQEKSAGLTQEEIITASDVEMAMLEKIKQDNRSVAEDELSFQSEHNVSSSSQDSEIESLLPDVPQPGVDNVRPENPTEQIMKEIEDINPNRP